MAAAQQPVPNAGPDSLSLEYVMTCLVKFYVGSREEVLPRIPRSERESQKVLDQKHIDEAKAEGVAERQLMRDRIRPGHLDTGFPVYDGETNVSLPTFAEGIMRRGYGFRDVHWFQQGKISVIVFAFEWQKPSAENVDELNRMFAHYSCHSWTLSLWDNPNLTSTVNCKNRRRTRAERKLVVGEKRIRIV